MCGMELGSSDDFRELFHVDRLDVYDIEGLILNAEVPEIYAQIIGADICLAVGVDTDGVDMVLVSIRIGTPRNGGYDGIMVAHTRQSESIGTEDLLLTTVAIAQIVLGNDLE